MGAVPVVVIERPRQEGEVHYKMPTVERDFVISGTTSRTVALLAVAEAAPTEEETVDNLGETIVVFRSKVKIKEIGGGVWEATVSYSSSPDTVDLVISFGVQTKKIYQSLATIKTYDCINGGPANDGPNAHGAVPDFKGVIGANGDEVEGVDIEVGAIEFSITKKWKRAIVPAEYLMMLMNFVGRETPVNHEEWTFTWLGQELVFPEGSLRFRTPTLKQSSSEELEISYNFAYASPMLVTNTPFTVGASSSITMEGWEYGWVHYKTNTSNHRVIKTPVAFVVSQVYPKKDFNLLEIEV
jgi:hypothetical protein